MINVANKAAGKSPVLYVFTEQAVEALKKTNQILNNGSPKAVRQITEDDLKKVSNVGIILTKGVLTTDFIKSIQKEFKVDAENIFGVFADHSKGDGVEAVMQENGNVISFNQIPETYLGSWQSEYAVA